LHVSFADLHLLLNLSMAIISFEDSLFSELGHEAREEASTISLVIVRTTLPSPNPPSLLLVISTLSTSTR
jgi:hypothetical protein